MTTRSIPALVLLCQLLLCGSAMAATREIPIETALSGSSSATGAELTLDQAGQLFFEGCQQYDNKHYDKASATFAHLIRAGYHGADVWYNLGNAYFRSGHLGHSIWAFSQAQALAVRNEDISANLGLARRQVVDALAEPKENQLLSVLFFWHYTFNLKERIFIVLVVNLLFWGSLLLRYWRRFELLKLFHVLFFLGLVGVGSSILIDVIWPTHWGVVISDQVAVKSAGDGSAMTLFELHSGTEFTIESSAGQWIQIRLLDGKRGWLNHHDTLLDGDLPPSLKAGALSKPS